MNQLPSDLPPDVRDVLFEVTAAAREKLGPTLRSVVLFGSAAEGRLRATSDVNLALVLSAFDASRIDALREPLRAAQAAIGLTVMYVLDGEVQAFARAFPEKVADIQRRSVLLHGDDRFAGLRISREAEVARLQQVLLNLVLRLRDRYVRLSLRNEQAARAVAEAAGPLRSLAASILDLEGRPAASPKEALRELAAELPGGPWTDLLGHMSEARERRRLPPGRGAPILLRVVDLATAMYERSLAAGHVS